MDAIIISMSSVLCVNFILLEKHLQDNYAVVPVRFTMEAQTSMTGTQRYHAWNAGVTIIYSVAGAQRKCDRTFDFFYNLHKVTNVHSRGARPDEHWFKSLMLSILS